MRMMAAQEERRAQEQRAMMAAIAELVQTQSPAKPASRRARAKNKKPSASPARAPKKNRTTPSPARAPKKKRTPTPTPARALQKNRKKTQTLPGKKKTPTQPALRRSPRKHKPPPQPPKKKSKVSSNDDTDDSGDNDDNDDNDDSDDSNYDAPSPKQSASGSSSEEPALARSPSLANLVAQRKNIRKRKSPKLVKMRNTINAKLKAGFDVKICRGDYHDKFHNFIPDDFEDAIRGTLGKLWPDHKAQATAFAIACDVAKRRYKYVNKSIIDLTSSKKKSKKVPKKRQKVPKRRKLIMQHPTSDEDLGSIEAMFEDSEGPQEVRFVILI